MPIKPFKEQNQLFKLIQPNEWQQLLPQLEQIDLPIGRLLAGPGIKQNFIYFPTSAIISLSYELENGSSTEVATIGCEGLVGISVFLGSETTINTATVKIAGSGYRLRSSTLLTIFNQSTSLKRIFLLFAQALVTQMTQTAVCNRHHRLEQQVCRFLLENSDRLFSDEITMTQELIAKLLGVRREGITEMALRIQKAGLIKYARGHITIVDRVGLEHRACECYRVVKSEYERLLL